MKISQTTFNILRNFAEINPDLIIVPGHVQSTFSISEHIYAQATIEEKFPSRFGIRDLGKFVNVLESHMKRGETKLTFTKNSIQMKNAGSEKVREATTNYRYGDMQLIRSETPGEIEFNNPEVKFEISKENFKWMGQMSSIIGAPNYVFESVDDTIQINACDCEGKVVDNSTLVIDDYHGSPLKSVLSVEDMKLIPGDYEVEIVKRGLMRFTNKVMPLHYLIAIQEKHSITE